MNHEIKPLSGKTVLVTRAAHQAEDLAEKLRTLGARVLFQPAIFITVPKDETPFRHAVSRLDEQDWVVFSSANGVHAFFRMLEEMNVTLGEIGHLKWAAVGPGTVTALAEYSVKTDVVPTVFRGEEMADALIAAADFFGSESPRFLLIRASRGREILAEKLVAAGGAVTQVTAYSSEDVTRESPLWSPEILEEMEVGRIDWVTVTSSAVAGATVNLFGESLRKTKIVSISPLTSETLRNLGFPPAAEAEEAVMEGMVAEMMKDVAAQ